SSFEQEQQQEPADVFPAPSNLHQRRPSGEHSAIPPAPAYFGPISTPPETVSAQPEVEPIPERLETASPVDVRCAFVHSEPAAVHEEPLDPMEQALAFDSELQNFCEKLPTLLVKNEALRSQLMSTVDMFTERVLMGELAHSDATETLRIVAD